ncbi:cytidine deaminase [Porphyromonas loveana]|uniref:cytidine deaminase n=1 Tax=Porphyromonas loveana TaxID=1884669 RepID=UPI0035A176C9
MQRKTLTTPYDTIPRAEFSANLLRLEEAAVQAARSAYAPYSHFSVGAAALLDNGEILAGSNQENAAYPSGLCAERTVLFYAGARYPDAAVQEMVVVAFSATGRVPLITPCGACRQVMMEVCSRHRPFPVLMIGADEAVRVADARFLLPFAFDGSDFVP